MDNNLKTKDITKKIFLYKTSQSKISFLENNDNSNGVSISNKNINSLKITIPKLLENSKSMIITNQNLDLNKKDTVFNLKINLQLLQLTVDIYNQSLDYKFNINDNILLLNNNPANILEANEFNTFFNRIILNMVNEGYEVIKDER